MHLVPVVMLRTRVAMALAAEAARACCRSAVRIMCIRATLCSVICGLIAVRALASSVKRARVHESDAGLSSSAGVATAATSRERMASQPPLRAP